MHQEIILKKNIFGGFNRKQVIECIAQLKSENTNTVSEKELATIKNTLRTYTETLDDKNNTVRELKSYLAEISKPEASRTSHNSINNINKIILNAKSQAELITKKTEENIENKRKKAEELLLKLISINEETERIKTTLTNAMLKLSEININDFNKAEEIEPIKTEEHNINTETNITESTVEDIDEYLNRTEENFNSIDNFFAELYKMTNGKLFEPRKLPENIAPDDFEYEY